MEGRGNNMHAEDEGGGEGGNVITADGKRIWSRSLR